MKKLVLALAITAAASQASALSATLISVESQNWEKYVANPASGYSAGMIAGGVTAGVPFSASTQVWDFDGSSITATGDYVAHWRIHPGSSLYTQTSGDLSISLGGNASASTYSCAEGNFGAAVGGNLCGNWELGVDYVNQSSMTYNIGGDASNQLRTIGGDDVISGPAQALTDYDNTAADDNATYLGLVNGTGQTGSTGWTLVGNILKIHNMTGNTTQTLTFEVSAVPVPAAAWLFGSALVGLAGVGRKRKMA
jgi:hypothetical protein